MSAVPSLAAAMAATVVAVAYSVLRTVLQACKGLVNQAHNVESMIEKMLPGAIQKDIAFPCLLCYLIVTDRAMLCVP